MDVHSITSATSDWRDGLGMPIACFALVTGIDSEFPSLAPGRYVIAIGESEVGQDLVGSEIEDRMINIERG